MTEETDERIALEMLSNISLITGLLGRVQRHLASYMCNGKDEHMAFAKAALEEAALETLKRLRECSAPPWAERPRCST